MKLKICGMRYADNIREAAKLSPDFMGFIFYPKSRRYVGEDFIMPELPSSIKKVGVFVNESLEVIGDKVKKYNLDLVQLHGDESPEYCKEVGGKVQVIKAFGIEEGFNFSLLKEYEHCCEYFLFDTKSSEYGGTGKEFDRTILWNYNMAKPYFLSGGITVEEVRTQKPEVRRSYALDVNSKFETKPGFKDLNKLKLLKDELSGK